MFLILYRRIIKRLFDIFIALILFLPSTIIVAPIILVSFLSDRSNPFYLAKRVGKRGKGFQMIKLRSMIKFADKKGIYSTKVDDPRITKIGSFIRRYKLDELPQLINVFLGDMSFVGPRPNTYKNGVELYTELELELLEVRPGVTDFSSIVFSDESIIIANSSDPDKSYNEIIRPWKSELGLFYIKNYNVFIDISLIIATVIALINKKLALKLINFVLVFLGADQDLLDVSMRKGPLPRRLPPGSYGIRREKF